MTSLAAVFPWLMAIFFRDDCFPKTARVSKAVIDLATV